MKILKVYSLSKALNTCLQAVGKEDKDKGMLRCDPHAVKRSCRVFSNSLKARVDNKIE